MKTEIPVVLDRPARKSGADRYAGIIQGIHKGTPYESEWKVYIPQSLTRVYDKDVPVNTFLITIESG